MNARESALRAVLDAVVDDRILVAAAVAAAQNADDAWCRALGSFASFLARDHRRAVDLADEALAAATGSSVDDPELLGLARAVRGLASAGGEEPRDGADPLGDALAAGDAGAASAGPAAAPAIVAFTAYLLSEAALACARLDLAAEFDARIPAETLGHPYDVIVGIMRVRLLVFRGRITEAAERVAGLPEPVGPLLPLLVAATETLVRGNAAERGQVRALADRLERAHPEPRDYLGAGCYLLAAFGLVAVGDVSRSARLALLAGGGPDLEKLVVVDRGLTFELLVAGAALEGDLDAADSWWARAQPLVDSPIAGSTIERLNSRVALLHGDAAAAIEWGDRAVASATAQGRAIEAAEGEIVAARARIAASDTGDASARLERLVEGADLTGYRALRRAASRELRAAGRRLRPASGSDWEGLSPRERDVALMVAEGLGNREIAAELHLSEHTVRAHVSRVLAAFGAASRFVVAARIAELFPEEDPSPVPPLTPRQEAVAARVAAGAGNAEIGGDLGLSVKTVEKHVGEIFRRWEVASRVGIARRYRSLRQAPS